MTARTHPPCRGDAGCCPGCGRGDLGDHVLGVMRDLSQRRYRARAQVWAPAAVLALGTDQGAGLRARAAAFDEALALLAGALGIPVPDDEPTHLGGEPR